MQAGETCSGEMFVGLKRLGVIAAVIVRSEVLPSLPESNSKIVNILSTPWRLSWVLSIKHCIYLCARLDSSANNYFIFLIMLKWINGLLV